MYASNIGKCLVLHKNGISKTEFKGKSLTNFKFGLL